jgi:hypothetical protein
MCSARMSFLFTLLAGCGQVLGVGEYTITPNDRLDASTPDAEPFVTNPMDAAPLDAMLPDATLPDPGPQPPAACGSVGVAGPACAACANTLCCTELASCTGNDVCRKTYECYADCAEGDQICRGKCNAAIPYDVPAERALERCLAVRCEKTCQVGCGSLLPLQRAQRFRLRPGCCDAEKAMRADDAAYAWQECQSSCFWPRVDSAPGVDTCGCPTSTPEAKAVAEVLASCAVQVQMPEVDWSCLGSVQWPALPPGGVELRTRVIKLVSNAPLPGVKVRACGGYDGECNDPVSEVGLTDDAGVATLAIERPSLGGLDFYRYLLITGPEIPDTLYYFQAPAPIRQTRWDARAVLTNDLLRQFYEPAEVTRDPELGSIGVLAMDCNPRPAAGVQIVSDKPAAKVLYPRLSAPDKNATTTDETGQALLLNVLPGTVVLSFSLGEKTFAQLPVQVRPGGVTIVVTSPMP